MVRFEKSKVDGYWICKDCGVAVMPTPEEVSEHITKCSLNKNGVEDG